MVWSHNESWMVTGDHAGYVKYWQSNMNNVKMFQAHKEAIRGLRYTIHHTSPYVSCATVIDDPSILAVVEILDMTLILFLFWFYNIFVLKTLILVWVHRWFLVFFIDCICPDIRCMGNINFQDLENFCDIKSRMKIYFLYYTAISNYYKSIFSFFLSRFSLHLIFK